MINHPSITALEAAMSKLATAQHHLSATGTWIVRCNKDVDPKAWIAYIEDSVDNRDKLQAIKAQYEEKALTAMSYWLSHQIWLRQVQVVSKEVEAALRALLTAYDAIGKSDNWLRPIMQMLCIKASEMLEFPLETHLVNAYSEQFREAEAILTVNFKTLATQIKQSKSFRTYTTDLVTPGKTYASDSSSEIELRILHMTYFGEYSQSNLPLNDKLAALFEQIAPLLQNVGEATRQLNFVKFPDRNYAESLLQSVRQNADVYQPKPLIERQNRLRRHYESLRYKLMLASRQLHEHYEELCQTLHGAVTETNQLMHEVQKEKYAHYDRWTLLRLCMKNCLAVDLILRDLGRQLQYAQNMLNHDESAGAGRKATETRFAEIEKSFR